MFETGIVIFLSLAFVFIKLKRRTMLRLLRYDMAIDLAVTVLALAIHWGTFSGVMAATFAGLLTSVGISLVKKAFGYIDGHHYHPGYVRLDV